mgnify:CR=1 FL=1
MSKPASVWRMRRAELLEALIDMNVKYDPSMTVPELRSIYMEARGPQGKTGLGLTKCSVDQLKERCLEEGLEIPPKATQGLLMRMLRYSMETTGDSEVTFGQYKNYLFKEVPKDYLEWAITEWSTSSQCSPDLARLARWADRQRQGVSRSQGYGAKSSKDPELTAKTKPPPVAHHVRPRAQPKEKSVTPARKSKTRPLEESDDFSMVSSVDGPMSTEEEIHELQERLKILQTVKMAEDAAKTAVPRDGSLESQ